MILHVIMKVISRKVTNAIKVWKKLLPCSKYNGLGFLSNDDPMPFRQNDKK